ncbi:type I-E CRISPR-associated protein Cse2/CasB [Pararhodospirillum photometricum]|uniref:type I-E CRISPR-associated protein Cse2/CasB n=1 Tax=Pararhodospirillum photometricum TaxID=1084 RepID=UPI0002F90E8E|nr:type I-E CRISPR-associated protein Cse2/CasB [Pararhodospirillum photometricum]
MTKVSFDPGALALEWWTTAQRDRGALARLRRCTSVTEALLESPTVLLWRCFGAQDKSWALLRAGVMAAVLAHVRDDAPLPVARVLGEDKGGSPLLSEGRLRRLLLVPDIDSAPDEVLQAHSRLVRFLRGKVNVSDLAASLYWWNDRTRQRWAFQYYHVDPPRSDAPDLSLFPAGGEAP